METNVKRLHKRKFKLEVINWDFTESNLQVKQKFDKNLLRKWCDFGAANKRKVRWLPPDMKRLGVQNQMVD